MGSYKKAYFCICWVSNTFSLKQPLSNYEGSSGSKTCCNYEDRQVENKGIATLGLENIHWVIKVVLQRKNKSVIWNS